MTLNIGPPRRVEVQRSESGGIRAAGVALSEAVRIAPGCIAEDLDPALAKHPEVVNNVAKHRVSVELYEVSA